ncbi:hypothetical protein STCU_03071 [Strigomonas culicis]|uniref:MYND-type domain-containing protein n=1 Tax=Strigomonas culicis TaxID=28005 RepID=S9UM83_9TRYP|nr:hypothetical protein STCU_03071 [Strigomonas culicis]|eukprot:EPY31952.1 hypothetical protein STCU_03071 [Strigomonas culicis]
MSKKDKAKLPNNEASNFGYPFADMKMEWFEDYLSTLNPSEQNATAARVMECLMAHTILHDDPLLKGAVTELSRIHLKSILSETPNPFEIEYLVFQTVCLTANFPFYDEKKQTELLTKTEERLKDIDKVTKQKQCSISNKRIAPTIFRAIDNIRNLQSDRKSNTIYTKAMNALKELFFFTYGHRMAYLPDRPTPDFNTFVCCDGCPCFADLRSTYTIYLRDIEKAKIVDCVTIVAVLENDKLLSGVAKDLLECHYNGNVLDDPSLDNIVNLIHNGVLFKCRAAVFFAINQLYDLQQMQQGLNYLPGDAVAALNFFMASMLWVKDQVKTMRDIDNVMTVLNATINNAERLHPYLSERIDCTQDLYNLVGNARTVFTSIAEPACHLAVHSRDVLYGKSSEMRCNNAKCPKLTNELLKCGGCDTTYYCSAACQKADWEGHKAFCQEIQSRRMKPPVTEYVVVYGECGNIIEPHK